MVLTGVSFQGQRHHGRPLEHNFVWREGDESHCLSRRFMALDEPIIMGGTGGTADVVTVFTRCASPNVSRLASGGSWTVGSESCGGGTGR